MPNQILHKLEKFLISKYGNVEILHSEIRSGYRNFSIPIFIDQKEKLNIIFYKSEQKTLENIRQIHQVTRILNHYKFPCRYSIDNKIYQISLPKRNYYFAIYNFLKGNTKEWQMFTKRDLKHVGRLMAEMHKIMKDCKDRDAQSCVSTYISSRNKKLVNLMQKYFKDQNVINAMREKLKLKIDHGNLHEVFDFTTSHKSLPSHLETASQRKQDTVLHMDFVRGNIIFKDKKINGIIDFEKVIFGDIHFDLARTFAFFLVDLSHKTYEEIYEQFILKGYFSNIQTDIDPELIEKLINFYLIYDFYKFLKYNPYEFLGENYHFVRTKDILGVRGIIQK